MYPRYMRLVPEYDFIELGYRSHFSLIAHQPFGNGVDRVKNEKLCDASTTCRGQPLKGLSSLLRVTPAPNNRAVADSFWKSFAADCATASTTCGAMAGTGIRGAGKSSGRLSEMSQPEAIESASSSFSETHSYGACKICEPGVKWSCQPLHVRPRRPCLAWPSLAERARASSRRVVPT